MKNRTWIFIFLALNISAQGYSLTTAVDFLKLGVGARAAGMGESFAGIYSDVSAVYWNPAGLAKIQKLELGVMHSEAITDASIEFIGLAMPVSNYGVFCLSSILYFVKPIPVTMADGKTSGDLNWVEGALILSCGKRITDKLSCGAGGKIIQRIESDPIFGRSEGTAYAMDAGLIYELPVKGLNFGFAVLNTGTELQMSGETKKDALPQTTRAGLAYERQLDNNASVVLIGDIRKVLDGNWFGGCGAEINFKDFIFLRTGYYQKEANISGITYGFGVKVTNFQIDYSNIPSTEMVGYTRNNKISVIVQF